MPGSESNPTDLWQNALNVFTDWLRAREQRANVEALCAGRADLADELRQLHSAFQLAQAVASSRSFHQTLREQFGNAEEITVKLEEGFAPAPRGEGFAGGQTALSQGVPLSGPPRGPAQAGTPTARYALEGEVARGGMGVIWRVRDCDLSRTLAMKVMTGAPGSSQQATDATTKLGFARFLEEAQVTAQLDHPGIVPVHEVGFDAQGQPFFTMKLVKGRDLNEIFKLARAGEGCSGESGAVEGDSDVFSLSSPEGGEGRGEEEERVGSKVPSPRPSPRSSLAGRGSSAESREPRRSEGWNLPRAVGVVVKACQ